MKIRLQRIDNSLPLPEYQTSGAAGFDIYAREKTTIKPNQHSIIPSNLIIQAPRGYFLAILPRSSLFIKKGLILGNSIGVIDSDYSGPKDEIGILVYNIKNREVGIDRGERIAQGIIVKFEKADWEEAEIKTSASRGGFGSTG